MGTLRTNVKIIGLFLFFLLFELFVKLKIELKVQLKKILFLSWVFVCIKARQKPIQNNR